MKRASCGLELAVLSFLVAAPTSVAAHDAGAAPVPREGRLIEATTNYARVEPTFLEGRLTQCSLSFHLSLSYGYLETGDDVVTPGYAMGSVILERGARSSIVSLVLVFSDGFSVMSPTHTPTAAFLISDFVPNSAELIAAVLVPGTDKMRFEFRRDEVTTRALSGVARADLSVGYSLYGSPRSQTLEIKISSEEASKWQQCSAALQSP